jgi:hypothetical protein
MDLNAEEVKRFSLLVALHDELMRSCNKVDVVCMAKLGYDIATEEVAGTAGRHRPTSDLIGVAPHEVTHSTIVGHFLLSVETTDFIKGIDRWGKTAMDTEDLIIDDGSEGKIVEDLCTVSPHVDRTVLSQALVVKAVDLGDLPRLVVASDEGDPLWVSHLFFKTTCLPCLP